MRLTISGGRLRSSLIPGNGAAIESDCFRLDDLAALPLAAAGFALVFSAVPRFAVACADFFTAAAGAAFLTAGFASTGEGAGVAEAAQTGSANGMTSNPSNTIPAQRNRVMENEDTQGKPLCSPFPPLLTSPLLTDSHYLRFPGTAEWPASPASSVPAPPPDSRESHSSGECSD